MTDSLIAPMVIGRQRFDGLGRQVSIETGGRLTRFHYQADQLPPAANTLADGSRIEFAYEADLDNQLLSTTYSGRVHKVDYDPVLAKPVSAAGGIGRQRWTYSAAGHPATDTWTIEGEDNATRWRHSLNGLLLGFDDAAGNVHDRRYDALGRLAQLDSGQVRSAFTYDAFSRPARISTQDLQSGRQMIKTLSYDAMGRERTRTFEVIDQGVTRTVTQTLGYNALDQLACRTWSDGQRQGEERFVYDLRARLIEYRANADAAPADPFGNRIVRQVFSFNALDGFEKVLSHFEDGTLDEAVFSYAEGDPTQVVKIAHTHPSWPEQVALQYDACGRVIADSLGRSLEWDSQDRLVKVSHDQASCEYGYDPCGHLTDRLIEGNLTRSYFSANQITHERRLDETSTFVSDGRALLAMNRLSAAVRETILLGTDAQGTVRLHGDAPLRTYTVYGAEPQGQSANPFGFAAERKDEFTGWYIPGGYRPYDPLLMCFLSPDNESPFGRGGLNPYAYCGADPVNRIDPDGHSWLNYVISGVGFALGAAALISSLGIAAPVLATLFGAGAASLSATGALAIGAAAMSALSLGTGIASVALEASGHDETAASVLGWISMGTGLAGVGLGIAPNAMVRLAARAARKPGRAGAALGQPVATKPLYTLGKGDVFYERGKGGADVAFIERLWDTDHAAFVTHGWMTGRLMNAQGIGDSAAHVARDLIAPQLAAIGYPANQKIVLLACWAGRNGAAQTVANVLKRPVEAYADKIYIGGFASLQLPMRTTGKLQFGGTTAPTRKIPAWDRVFANKRGPFSDKPDFELAPSQIFNPV